MKKVKCLCAAAFLSVSLPLAADDSDIEKSFIETVREWENPAELSSVPVMVWWSSSRCTVLYSSEKFVSYKVRHERYTGGAHGMTVTKVGTFRNRKRLKISDLPKDVPALWKKAVAKHFKAASFDAYMKTGPSFIPKITENFYLDGKVIHFIYDPYEIDFYAVGTVDIFVPYTLK